MVCALNRLSWVSGAAKYDKRSRFEITHSPRRSRVDGLAIPREIPSGYRYLVRSRLLQLDRCGESDDTCPRNERLVPVSGHEREG